MADAFMSGLVIGLVLIAAMMLAFNTNWGYIGSFASSGSWVQPAGTQPELVTAELGTSYLVGNALSTRVVEYDLGRFVITGIADRQLQPGGIVQSGVLFGEAKLSYSASNPQIIEFTVARTNSYAPLIVKVNDKVVFEEVASLGKHSIALNAEGPAKIEFLTQSSGWKIWAPSLYEISNVAIYATRPKVSFNFAPGEDFVHADLVLDFAYGFGRLGIDLNGERVWRGEPGSGVVVTLDNMKDSNIISLQADAGSGFAGTATLIVYYTHAEKRAFETTFNLTQEQLEKLPGHITFEVPSVKQSGSIVVKLVVGNQTKLAQALDAKAGTYAVAFFPSNIVPGELTKLVVESTDALFYLRNLKVWV